MDIMNIIFSHALSICRLGDSSDAKMCELTLQMILLCNCSFVHCQKLWHLFSGHGVYIYINICVYFKVSLHVFHACPIVHVSGRSVVLLFNK